MKVFSFKVLVIDSLDVFFFVFDLDDEICGEFLDEELLKISTVQDLLDLIDSKK